MSNRTTSRRMMGFVAWLIVFHVLLAYGLPEWLFATLVILFGILYYRIGVLGALTVSLTLVVITVVYGLALKITGLEDSIYFRPDEKYARYDYSNNHRGYQPNVHVETNMRHGDLRAMTTEDIAEPRHMIFDTDSQGFRNERDYHGQRYLLVGDSFAAGNSNSQPDVLYAQLLAQYGLDTYSRAYQGNLVDYASYIQSFQRHHGDNFRVLLFIFEGNDFEESRARPEYALARFGRRYYSLFSDFNTYRVTMSLYKRLTRGRAIHEGSAIEVHELAGKKVAFYQPYIAVTRRASWPEPEGFEKTLADIKPVLERVYFVPTKYRVYFKHLKPDENLPNAQWEYLNGLCRKYQLRCSNLTEPLVRESDILLKQGEFTWWRDDTHWNRHGIAVAARMVANDLHVAELKDKQH
jgi:hypothetical protein